MEIGKIIKIQNGYAFKSGEYVKGGFRIIRIKNVQNGEIIDDNPIFIDLTREKEFIEFVLNENDILISLTGNPGRVGKMKKEYLPALLNQRVGKINIISDKINSKFLFIYLNTKKFEENVTYLSSGIAQLNVSTKQIEENIQIPLPPKEIQQKIVDEVEKIENQIEENKQKIQDLKIEIEKIITEIPEFNIVKIGDIAKLLKRGKSPKYGDSNVQIIKSGQARGMREFDFTNKYFVEKGFQIDERKLKKGDLLINSTGVGTAGRVTQFNLNGDFLVDSHITIFRVDEEKANSTFVLYSLASLGFKNIEKMAVGQSGQIELSLKIIENIKIPLPSLEFQNFIVEEIEKLEKNIGQSDNLTIGQMENGA